MKSDFSKLIFLRMCKFTIPNSSPHETWFHVLTLNRVCTIPLGILLHYSGVIMSRMASQITSVSIVCSAICSGTHQRKHQSSTSLAFVRRIHRGTGESPHQRPVTRKMFSFDDVIITTNITTTFPVSTSYHCRYYLMASRSRLICNKLSFHILICEGNPK